MGPQESQRKRGKFCQRENGQNLGVFWTSSGSISTIPTVQRHHRLWPVFDVFFAAVGEPGVDCMTLTEKGKNQESGGW